MTKYEFYKTHKTLYLRTYKATFSKGRGVRGNRRFPGFPGFPGINPLYNLYFSNVYTIFM